MSRKGKKKQKAQKTQTRRADAWTPLERTPQPSPDSPPDRATRGGTRAGKPAHNRRGGQRDRGNRQPQGGGKMWVNPYYFVGRTSGPDKPWWTDQNWEAISHERQIERHLSGWIDLKVTTRGYLSFGDPERTWRYKCGDDTKDIHRVSNFFQVNGRLAVPGSEFRGMIRTNLEAVLDARAAVLDSPPAGWKYKDSGEKFERCSYRLVRGTPLYNRKPGILHGGKIIPCRLVKLRRWDFIEQWKSDGNDPAQMHGRTYEVPSEDGSTNETGYVCVPRDHHPEEMPNQVSKNILVFVPDLEGAHLDLSNKVLQNARVADDRFDLHSRRFPMEGEAENGSMFVYYWKKNGEVKEIGAVGMFRSAEQHSWKDIVDRDKSLWPAKTAAELDPVSRLFGWIPDGDEEGQGFMGRLSFEPLIGPVADDQSLTEWRTLPIRGEPKPQYYPFYLRGTGGPGRYSGDGAHLRGRKFYWHFPVGMRDELPKIAPNPEDPPGDMTPGISALMPSNQNATERLCERDQPFEGRIYFSNLEPWELGALLWTMTFSADPMNPPQEAYGHHLGGGAATGFGSVQISVTGVHTVDHAKEWEGFDENGITDAKADDLVQSFFTKIGSQIGLSTEGVPAAGSAIGDWLKGHELEALACWKPEQIGYRQGTTQGGEVQAPRYYGEMRKRRDQAAPPAPPSGQGHKVEEPLRNVQQIIKGKGQTGI